jgi:predicted GNAT superfamily acetyltransferase
MISIRRLTEIGEFRDAVRLQQEIWHFAEVDVLPVRLFVVCKKIGGQAFGAFDGGRMIGFCVALPAIQHGAGGIYLHSNMLGVSDGYRNAGVGRLLKLAQREDAVSRGIELMEWTFDPLEIKNAYFNMERLGAVVRRYVLNFYGVTTSALHGGLPTDRCICEWHLDTDRVRAALAGAPRARGDVLARIEVPSDIEQIRKSDPARAREIQASVSRQFQQYTGAGLAATGVERNDRAGVYLFTKWES